MALTRLYLAIALSEVEWVRVHVTHACFHCKMFMRMWRHLRGTT